jgi:hypothetical protein
MAPLRGWAPSVNAGFRGFAACLDFPPAFAEDLPAACRQVALRAAPDRQRSGSAVMDHAAFSATNRHPLRRKNARAVRETTMEELVARVTQATGLDATTAQTAIGHILAFLQKEGPAEEVGQLIAAMPGAEAAIAQAGAGEGGGGLMGMLGGMMGGGVMALGQKLMSAGVPMGQMQPLGRELFAYGREKAGEDVMGPIVGAIPGLSQFV